MGKKRTAEDYEREIEEAAKRMKKYPEHLRSARTSRVWNDFLIDIGVKPEIVKSKSGSDFWEQVREQLYTRQAGRRDLYMEAREAGMSSKLARRIRDFGEARAQDVIEKWRATHWSRY